MTSYTNEDAFSVLAIAFVFIFQTAQDTRQGTARQDVRDTKFAVGLSGQQKTHFPLHAPASNR